MKLSKRINIIFAVAILIPILLIAMFFYMNIRGSFNKRAEDNLKYSVEEKAENIDRLIQDAEGIAAAVGMGDMLQEILQNKYGDYEEFYKAYNNPVTNFVKDVAAVTAGIDEIFIYTSNPYIDKSSIYINFSMAPEMSAFHKRLDKEEKTMCINSELRTSGVFQNILEPNMMMYYKIIPVRSDYKYRMGISVSFDMDKIYEWLQEDDGVKYYLINDENEVVASTNGQYEPVDMTAYEKYSDELLMEDGINYEYRFSNELEGYRLIGESDKNIYVGNLNRISFISLALISFMLIISANILFSITRPYSVRLDKLADRMSNFDSDNMEPIVTKHYNDEVEIVINSFNHMLSDMDRLINEVYALNIQKTELELNQIRIQMEQLINQVNPHFLFNTLNAILAIGERNNYTEVNWCIAHLSKMMRKLLDWSDDKIIVDEELSFVRMYLDIEKLRFAELFEYDINVGEDTKTLYIPKMSIQPLVENACKHGIHKHSGCGKVIVNVWQEENVLYVNVKDNGNMLSKEQIKHISEKYLQQDDEGQSEIGLKNIYKRLKLYYGDDTEFIIYSENDYNCFGFKIIYTRENLI